MDLEGWDWESWDGREGSDRPEVVDAAFDRGVRMVGVAVMGLALSHPDPAVVYPRILRALASEDSGLRYCGLVALSHAARLHHAVDGAALRVLRRLLDDHAPIRDLRTGEEKKYQIWGTAEEMMRDVWIFVPHRRLPLWMWYRCWWSLSVGGRIQGLWWWLSGLRERDQPPRA